MDRVKAKIKAAIDRVWGAKLRPPPQIQRPLPSTPKPTNTKPPR